jgi:hypothetical protein
MEERGLGERHAIGGHGLEIESTAPILKMSASSERSSSMIAPIVRCSQLEAVVVGHRAENIQAQRPSNSDVNLRAIEHETPSVLVWTVFVDDRH